MDEPRRRGTSLGHLAKFYSCSRPSTSSGAIASAREVHARARVPFAAESLLAARDSSFAANPSNPENQEGDEICESRALMLQSRQDALIRFVRRRSTLPEGARRSENGNRKRQGRSVNRPHFQRLRAAVYWCKRSLSRGKVE